MQLLRLNLKRLPNLRKPLTRSIMIKWQQNKPSKIKQPKLRRRWSKLIGSSTP